MKKFVKPLVIAASVAAIAGVGAVSFAAWSAGTDNTKDVENNTLGKVSVLKFDTSVTTSPVTGLLPIDQNTDAYDATTNPVYGVTEFQIVTSAGYGYSDFKLKVEIDATGIDAGTKFYVSDTAPSASSKGTEIDATNGAELTYNIQTSGNYSLYVCHDSSEDADMEKSFKLTLTLSDGTTAVVSGT